MMRMSTNRDEERKRIKKAEEEEKNGNVEKNLRAMTEEEKLQTQHAAKFAEQTYRESLHVNDCLQLVVIYIL